MEDDDPIVQEIPVYLSQALAKNLHIYQYPVRPANRDWKDCKVENVSIKPRNNIVRMEIGLDPHSDKYCASKGEQIAVNTDGMQGFVKDKDSEKNRYFKNNVMDKIVYESSSPCQDTKHYAIALLQDKELHCTPIQGIVQLRPSYSYYDKQDKRKQEKKELDVSDDEEQESEPQQVTVKFARVETEVAKKAREKSFHTISRKVAEEPWYDGLWKNSDSDQAELERLKLFSNTTSDGSALTLSARDYIKELVPTAEEDNLENDKKKITLQDFIKETLIEAKLMTFAELREAVRRGGHAGGAGGEAALLSALGASACCVRGVWAARSQDVYPRAAPAPPRLMCAARDHVLYLFTQHPYVDRRKVTAAVRLPASEVLAILQSVAKLNSNGGWELLLPPDLAFEAKYPDIIQRQNLYWEARQRQFNEMLMGECVPKRQRKKSQRDSIGSDTMLSPKPRCNSESEESDRKRYKNKSSTGVGKRTRDVSAQDS